MLTLIMDKVPTALFVVLVVTVATVWNPSKTLRDVTYLVVLVFTKSNGYHTMVRRRVCYHTILILSVFIIR